MAVLTLALALAAAQPTAVVQDPPYGRGMPPRASDHVVVMAVEESRCPTCAPQRRTIRRSGTWLREDEVYADRSETSFSDFASGTSVLIVREPTGAIRRLSVERMREGDSRRRHRTATGRRDEVLGEPCEIWAISGENHVSESCETADGVQLRLRYPAYGGGADIESSQAISVERRPLRPGNVRPPADFFAHAPWPARTAAGNAPAYSVRLVSTRRGEAREQIRRGQGNLGSGERDSDDGTRHFSGGDGTNFFSFDADADGRPIRLEVGRPDARYRFRWREQWTPVAGAAPATCSANAAPGRKTPAFN
jgi:hypothetical protein